MAIRQPPHSNTLLHVRTARKLTKTFGVGAALRDIYRDVDFAPSTSDLDDLLRQIK